MGMEKAKITGSSAIFKNPALIFYGFGESGDLKQWTIDKRTMDNR